MDVALTRSSLIFASQIRIHLHTVTDFGRCEKCWSCGGSTSTELSSHHGLCAWMSPCPSGYQNEPVQAGYSVPGSLIHKTMSYHTICCGSTGILFDYEIVEDKDRPLQFGKAEFQEENHKTGGLLFRLTKSFTTHQNMLFWIQVFVFLLH